MAALPKCYCNYHTALRLITKAREMGYPIKDQYPATNSVVGVALFQGELAYFQSGSAIDSGENHNNKWHGISLDDFISTLGVSLND